MEQGYERLSIHAADLKYEYTRIYYLFGFINLRGSQSPSLISVNNNACRVGEELGQVRQSAQ